MVALTDPAEPVRAVIEQAASWQVQLADEDCGEADRVAFTAWLDADPSHRTAFDRMAAIAGRAARQGPVERTALDTLFSRDRRRTGAVLASLLAVALIGWSAADVPQLRSMIADQRSAIGELKHSRTRNGDRIILDSDSAADIGESDRSVHLWQGRLLAMVAPGEPQPFIVHTPQGTARALGTRYSVRVDGDATFVRVIQSHVEACAAEGNHACITLAPGQAARLDAAGATRLASIDPAAELAWSEGMLVADDRPLAEILDELGRYRREPLRYGAVDLQGLHVTGTFPLTDSDRALASIGAALPVTIEQGPDGTRVRRR